MKFFNYYKLGPVNLFESSLAHSMAEHSSATASSNGYRVLPIRWRKAEGRGQVVQ